MKKKYLSPELEVSIFSFESVLASSMTDSLETDVSGGGGSAPGIPTDDDPGTENEPGLG